MVEPKIIKSEDYPKDLQKRIEQEQDKLFLFECEITDDKLALRLKELNKESSFYYESFYTFDELCHINRSFKACRDLEEAKKHLLKLFPNSNIKRSLNDSENLQITFYIYMIRIKEPLDFILEKKSCNN